MYDPHSAKYTWTYLLLSIVMWTLAAVIALSRYINEHRKLSLIVVAIGCGINIYMVTLIFRKLRGEHYKKF